LTDFKKYQLNLLSGRGIHKFVFLVRLGNYLLKGLEQLRNDFEIVGDVRGKGLMIGMEMVTDKSSKNPLQADKMVDIW
jgi:4-aminobutyrate aminotransferase-like enzyme